MSAPPAARSRARWLALGLGVLLGCACLGLGARLLRRRGTELVQVRGDRERLVELLAERARTASRSGPRSGGLRLEPFSEEDARRLFPQLEGRAAESHAFDPHVGYRLRGGLDRRVPFAEHPRGALRVRTNALGLRMDEEPSAAAPDLRVLVVGDSHTEGACDNAETFCALLAQDLRARLAPRTVEVLNAGRAGWSFYHYVGALESYRALDPDVALLVAYDGNDFYETLLLHHWHARTPLVPPPADPPASVPSGAWTQWLRQLVHFRAHPQEAELALEAAVGASAEFAARCEARGIRPLFVLLPALGEVRPQDAGADLAALERELGIDEEARALTGRLADRWLAALAARGLETLDLRPAFRSDARRLYWPLDGHLDLSGNALVADLLAEPLAR